MPSAASAANAPRASPDRSAARLTSSNSSSVSENCTTRGRDTACRDRRRRWRKALRRRSQKGRNLTWAQMNRIQKRWLPPARVLHPYPEVRFAATHPR